ncbi:hypothetical protein L195_g056557, partial [Trifolium pratense]
GLLRSVGFKSSCPPTLWYLVLERTFMLVAFVRELLALGFSYRVGSRSIRRS